MKKSKYRIEVNAPATIAFVVLCVLVYGLSVITKGSSDKLLFSVYRSKMSDFLTYPRFLGHVLGHVSWEHLFGNITMVLLLGPMLEEKYGTQYIIKVMLTVALVTGVFHFVFDPKTMLMGASGIVFAFILLSSITGYKENVIPLSFILIAVIYIGGQLYDWIIVKDDVSNVTHILGGVVGAYFGFVMNKQWE